MPNALRVPAAVGTASEASDSRAGDIMRLRRKITRMQRRRSEYPILPVAPALALLFPDGGLQVGTVYSLAPSPGLVGALLSPISRAGSWCAAVGMPTLGIEALAGHGVALERLALVPSPGARWVSVVSALSEVVPLIAVRPSGRVGDGELSRLTARLRDRGCTLLLVSATPWPQSEGVISVHDPRWHGAGEGWGLIDGCEMTITARTRRSPIPRSVHVRLPDAHGSIQELHGAQERPATHSPRLLAVAG
ncbi:hypothetical protein GCM10025768_20130 [Microbacterium pseudoresistens]|uniref:Protein ImuA n=1 Tax=Microbacterium pseudoresistens TaxID=640634 RepID=A0A7Y9EXC8_9MICO|nr:hypothetical protein [Microbacterium pseudoresistens]NYD55707.1 hypothetical protein [Microbacterium pseudoresistens]